MISNYKIDAGSSAEYCDAACNKDAECLGYTLIQVIYCKQKGCFPDRNMEINKVFNQIAFNEAAMDEVLCSTCIVLLSMLFHYCYCFRKLLLKSCVGKMLVVTTIMQICLRKQCL